jgi:hypothetical protein
MQSSISVRLFLLDLRVLYRVTSMEQIFDHGSHRPLFVSALFLVMYRNIASPSGWVVVPLEISTSALAQMAKRYDTSTQLLASRSWHFFRPRFFCLEIYLAHGLLTLFFLSLAGHRLLSSLRSTALDAHSFVMNTRSTGNCRMLQALPRFTISGLKIHTISW